MKDITKEDIDKILKDLMPEHSDNIIDIFGTESLGDGLYKIKFTGGGFVITGVLGYTNFIKNVGNEIIPSDNQQVNEDK